MGIKRVRGKGCRGRQWLEGGGMQMQNQVKMEWNNQRVNRVPSVTESGMKARE